MVEKIKAVVLGLALFAGAAQAQQVTGNLEGRFRYLRLPNR